MAESVSSTTAQSLYRTWRSRDFAEVVGQPHVTQTLRNAVRFGQVGHAYLFAGPRGTGKTSTARILARAVNCLQPRDGEPCNSCPPCQSMLANRCLDVVEIDAASNNSVDNVRDLRDKVNFAPTEVRRKVYIIDEVHMLSTSAFNALLKTLEEPPAHVLFVLATTDVHKVPATITSRCQRLDFRAIGPRDIVERLAYVCARERVSADEAALELIAQQATGSLRDALSLLEQVCAYEGATIGVAEVEEALGLARRETLTALAESVVAGDAGAALALIGALAAAGADMRQYARQLVQYWRDLLLLCAGGPAALGRAPDAGMAVLAARLSTADVTAILRAVLQPDYSGRRSASAQWQLELAVVEASEYFARAAAAAPSHPAQATSRPTQGARQTAQTASSAAVGPAQSSAGRAGAGPRVAASGSGSASGRIAEPAATFDTGVRATASPSDGPLAAPAAIGRVTSAARADALPGPQAGGEAPATVRAPVQWPAVSQHEVAAGPPPPHGGSTGEEIVDDVDVGGVLEARIPPEAADGIARSDGLVATSPPSVTAAPTLDVQQIWSTVQQRLTDAGKGNIAALVRTGCVPLSLDGDTFVLGFAPKASLQQRQVEAPNRRTVIEEALTHVAGRVVKLRCDTIHLQTTSQPSPAPSTSSEPPDTFVEDAARALRPLYMERQPR